MRRKQYESEAKHTRRTKSATLSVLSRCNNSTKELDDADWGFSRGFYQERVKSERDEKVINVAVQTEK